LSVILHHIAGDGASIGVFLRDLIALYRANLTQQPSGLFERPIQYREYAAWQRSPAVAAPFREQLEYWKTLLSGAPVIELPSDRPRRAGSARKSGMIMLDVPAKIDRAMRELSKREGLTPYVVWLAATAMMLRKITGRSEVVIGSPIAGREGTPLEHTIGFVANLVALRVELAGASSLREAIERTRDVVFGALAHRDVPFELVVKDLHINADLTHTPLFGACVNYFRRGEPLVRPPGVDFEYRPSPQFAVFDFELRLWDLEDHTYARAVYRADLFDQGRIEGWGRELLEILEQLRS
jgi:hypothetical protein